MKSRIIAGALSAGLVLNFGGATEILPPPLMGNLLDSTLACPHQQGKPLPTIGLKRSAWGNTELAEAVRIVDLDIQNKTCETAVRIGSALLDAANYPGKYRGYRVNVTDKAPGTKNVVIAKYRSNNVTSADFKLSDPNDPSKPVSLSRVIHETNRGDESIDSFRLEKVRLPHGAGWTTEISNLTQNRVETLLDVTQNVGSSGELDARYEQSLTLHRYLPVIAVPEPK